VLELAGLERRLAGMELSATLDLEALAELQRDLLRLKTDALDRFAAGELGGQSALSDLLLPLNAARDHVAGLMLHVRDNLEERAESEGKSVEALWDAAIDKAGTGGGSP